MSPNHDHTPARAAALKIATVYAIIGALWILSSGWLLHRLVHDAALSAMLENIKGWFYVLVTAVLLGLWLERYFRTIRRATELLQKSEARFSTIFKDSPIAVAISRLRDGVFVDANEALVRLLGYPREEILGGTSERLQLWHSSDRARKFEELREKKRVVADIRARCRNGEERDLLASLQLIELDGESCILGTLVDVTESKRAEAALRESERRFRSLIEAAPEAIFVQCDGTFQYVNQAMVRLMGAAQPEDLLGRPFLERIAPAFHNTIQERMRVQRETEEVAPPMEQVYLRVDGKEVSVETTAVTFRFQGQDGHLVFVRDITARREAEKERTRLEAQLWQAQKMESIGQLAGGVAHDFNNLLMGIMGYAELCRDKVAPEHPIGPWLDEIIAGAQRSAGITRQLLAFARRQTISPVVLNLDDHVAGMLKLLRRLIGEDVALIWRPGAQPARVKMDPSQVDQILANLVVNARDAIVGVGTLTIETMPVTFSAEYCAEHAGTTPGSYVMLAVTDSGSGMDRATMEHIFEPFFTTKAPGKGTGLGLATVYGIVHQNQGFVNVSSEPGEGTTFRIFIPQLDERTAAGDAAGPSIEVAEGWETVLLVEDDKSVRATTELFLQGLGYKVLTAADPGDALRQVGEHPGTIHLLITDVVMPGMSGRDLATRLAETFPDMACLYVSGYPAEVIAHHGVLNEGVHFLSKPFTRKELARTVRAALLGRRSR